MKKSLKTVALLGSSFILLSFTVVVINQTAGVVQLAKEVHPALGTVTLWGLLIAYGGIVGVPVVMIMRMPKPLSPPERASGPEFDEHIKRLGQRLAANKRVQLDAGKPIDRRRVEDAIRALDEDADAII